VKLVASDGPVEGAAQGHVTKRRKEEKRKRREKMM
jgi:hypothetical protein